MLADIARAVGSRHRCREQISSPFAPKLRVSERDLSGQFHCKAGWRITESCACPPAQPRNKVSAKSSRPKPPLGARRELHTLSMNQYVFNSFHSSVAAFSFDLLPATTDNPHQLTVIVGDDKKALALYFSYEAWKEAIRTQKTRFPPWDSLPAAIAASEFSDASRWVSTPVRFNG